MGRSRCPSELVLLGEAVVAGGGAEDSNFTYDTAIVLTPQLVDFWLIFTLLRAVR